MGAERLRDVVDERGVLRVVEIALLEEVGLPEQRLHVLVARLRERHRALLLVDLVILLDEPRHQRVDRVVEVGAVFERARDDERRPRLVDEDRVDLVDDREVVAALDHVVQFVFHVVAEVVEAVFVVGAIGDVAAVGRRPLGIVEAVDDDADGEAEEVVDLPHPFRVAAGEIVVDGDDVDALAPERVQVDGERGDEGLALAGPHLGDAALVKHHAADQLHVEMALAERALRRLAHGGEGGDEKVVEGLAVRDLPPEILGAGAELLVGEGGEFRLERIDLRHLGSVALEAAVVGRTEDLLGERAEHGGAFVVREELGRGGLRPRRAGCIGTLIREQRRRARDLARRW